MAYIYTHTHVYTHLYVHLYQTILKYSLISIQILKMLTQAMLAYTAQVPWQSLRLHCLPVTNATHGLQWLHHLNIETNQEATALMYVFTRRQNGESLTVLMSVEILSPVTVPLCHPSHFLLVLPFLQPLTQYCLPSWFREAMCQSNKKHFHCVLD